MSVHYLVNDFNSILDSIFSLIYMIINQSLLQIFVSKKCNWNPLAILAMNT